jgi:3-phosphoglycerate kinase
LHSNNVSKIAVKDETPVAIMESVLTELAFATVVLEDIFANDAFAVAHRYDDWLLAGTGNGT